MQEIKYIDRRTGEIKTEKVPGEKYLKFFYQTGLGKVPLAALIKRKITSAVGGWYMDSKRSKKNIDKFIADHGMDLSDYVVPKGGFKHFNDFFYRKLKPGARPIEDGIVSPADGKILVFPKVSDVPKFFVKGSEFDLDNFLNNKKLADKYKEGAMCIIRLAPVDYHRYHFPVKGMASENVKIKGAYYSVSPLALNKKLDIFVQNKREYMTVQSKEAGEVLICDVGATMTGGIEQTYTPNSIVEKGQEKGYFKFGGSTIVVLFEPETITFNQDLIENTQNDLETTIFMGEQIGE